MECCICEITSTTNETHIKKKDRQLPLQSRPEVLLLPFQNTFRTICIKCNNTNTKLIQQESIKQYQPSDFLHHIQAGNTDLAKLICLSLPVGACVHYSDPTTGDTALHIAARLGFFHLSRFILDRRRKNNQQPAIIQESLDPDYLHDDEDQVYNLRRTKHPEDLQLLDAFDQYHRTPLHVACSVSKRKSIIRVLAESGSDVNQYVNDSTPIMLVVSSGQDKCIELLHQHGAHVNKRSMTNGKTALMKSSSLGEFYACRALLKLNANATLVDHTGITAIEYALKRRLLDSKYEDIVKLIHTHLTDNENDGALPALLQMLPKIKVTAVSSTKSNKYGYAARQKHKAKLKWQEHWDALAEMAYWHNTETNVTTFDCPPGIEPSCYNPIIEEKLARSDSEEEEEAEEEEKYDPTKRKKKRSKRYQSKIERQTKLLHSMKEEYREYNKTAQKTVQDIQNGQLPIVKHNQRSIINTNTVDGPTVTRVYGSCQERPFPQSTTYIEGKIITTTQDGIYYQNLPDRTVHQKKIQQQRQQQRQQPLIEKRIPRPMNPHVYYDESGILSVNKVSVQGNNLYKTYEQSGEDFKMQVSAKDIDYPTHVWPGNYKRSGMGGEGASCGTLIEETEEVVDRKYYKLYEYKSGVLAQKGRDFMQKSQRKQNEKCASYKLYEGGTVKKIN